MPDEKNEQNNDFFGNNNNFDPIWLILLFMLFFGFYPNSNSMESYFKGKIDAYENVLKGFDDNGR